MNDMELNKFLPKPWQNFIKKINKFNDIPIKDWSEYQLLGHLCNRYNKTFNINFSLSLKGQPSKCSEIYMVKKIYAMLNTASSINVKEYVDWVFDKKIIPNKMKIKTIGYFTTAGIGNEFLLERAEKNKITKSTPIIKSYQQIAETLNIPIETYGDLAFAKLAIEQSTEENENIKPYKELFKILINMGLNEEMLKELK